MNYLTIEHLEMSYIQSCCFSIPKQLYNLKDLVIKNCSDQVAKALIDSSVNSLTHLTLWNINLNIPIKRPIPNLKGVDIDNSEIDVSKSTLLTKGGSLRQLMSHDYITIGIKCIWCY